MAMASTFPFTLLTSFAVSVVFSLPISVEPLLSSDSGHLHRYNFPKDFVFGATTSAYQVEGGVTEGSRGLNIWDIWSHTPGIVFKPTTTMASARTEEELEDFPQSFNPVCGVWS
ncbi:unnamed protein product [Calypogeia fissa]